MGPNNSMTPTNPANQPGNEVPISGPPPAPLGGPAPGEPRTIRDYLALARSQGQVPTFTDNNMGAGFDVRNDPAKEQAIPEEPQDDYEAMPFTQRMKINPYMRTKRRLPTLLPELWSQLFPNKQKGDPLDNGEPKGPERDLWNEEVKGLTGNLLKQHDKQYAWDRDNNNKSKVKRARDEQMWQKWYAGQVAKQEPPTDPKTGKLLTAREFIDQQMSIADEKQYNEDMAKKAEVQEAQVGTIEDLDSNAIYDILGKNPQLAKAIQDEVLAALGQIVGNPNLTDAEFQQMRQDPQWKDTFSNEVRKAIMNNQDAIMQFANSKPKAAPQGAIPEEPTVPENISSVPNGS